MSKLNLKPEQINYILWATIILLMVISILRPMGLPFNIGSESRKVYDAIEDLPDGSVVLYWGGASVGAWSEIGPGAEVAFQHLFSKDVKIIFASGNPTALQQFEYMLDKYSLLTDQKTYGEDYVIIARIVGGIIGIATLGDDFRAASGNTDYFGNQVETLSILDDVNGAEDVTLVFITDNGSATEQFVTQWWSKHESRLLVVTLAQMYSWLYPYTDGGQVEAMLSGLRGGADYEKLTNLLGPGVTGMDMVSLTHIAMIAGIVISNVLYFKSKREEVK